MHLPITGHQLSYSKIRVVGLKKLQTSEQRERTGKMSGLLEKPERILYTAEERPAWGTTLLLALTHVALIFDAVVFIPNVLGKVTQIPPEQIRFCCFATILVSALGSFLQAYRWRWFGTGFILFMGSYSAYLSCSIDAAHQGG